MYIKNAKTIFTVLCAMVIMLACGLPAAAEVTEVPATEAPATEAAATEVSVPPTEAAVIQHQTIPVGLPDNQSGQAGDFDSSKVLENGSLVGGDRFTFGRFERPFNANTMDVYFSQLDIVDTQVHQDDTWIFGSIKLKELNNNSSSAEKYALELDTDRDGKGDWLILSTKPTSTDWTVNGVQIYEDANNDVGLQMPMLTDENATNGDGFEVLAFDQGNGDDPDSAWVRISPKDANIIEFSVKKTAVGTPQQYLINMWAGTSLLDPSIFDLNDQFTHEQAGAADKGLEYFYPIKEVSEIDNTCRMAVGFQPNGSEPGICPVPELQQGSPVPPGASCPDGTFLFCSQRGCFCAPILIITFPTDPPPVP
ncbi:MAG: hypothetical protein IH588_08005 [Anaerolineales bacterium]|nr:hypothetical protein [Anaerolineales bacterium]